MDIMAAEVIITIPLRGQIIIALADKHKEVYYKMEAVQTEIIIIVLQTRFQESLIFKILMSVRNRLDNQLFK
jgi:hypothetical protein